jgi:hypothetical protein
MQPQAVGDKRTGRMSSHKNPGTCLLGSSNGSILGWKHTEPLTLTKVLDIVMQALKTELSPLACAYNSMWNSCTGMEAHIGSNISFAG